MPGGDRTGPIGAGPMTGRGAGFCTGNEVPGYMNSGPGRGKFMGRRDFAWGRGGGAFGWGRGRRNRYWATGVPGWARCGWAPYPMTGAEPGWGEPADTRAEPVHPQREAERLKQQAEYHERTLIDIRRRLESLQSTPESEIKK